jgi:hypothetical protein
MDGSLPCDAFKVAAFNLWLERAMEYFDHDEGAVNVYRIDL